MLARQMANTAFNRIVLRPQVRLAVVLLTTWLAGCGARPGMDSDPNAGSGPNTEPPDATLTLTDAEVLPPGCHWVGGERFQITEPPSDKGLHDMEVSADAVLLAWKTTNPDPPNDNTRYVQRVTWEGAPIGERTAVFPPPSGWTSYAGVSLATGPEHRGAILWETNTGCRFTRTDADGVTLGSLQYVDPELCTALRSTALGFSLFTRTSLYERRMVLLDATGNVTHHSEPIEAISMGGYWWASLALHGGDLLVAGIHDNSEPMPIVTQRIDAWGAPLTEPTVITTAHTDARRMRLVHTGNGVLAGWQASEAPDSPTQEQYVTLQQLDERGQPLGESFRAADVIAYRDGGWSVTRKGDRVLAVIVHPLEADTYGDDTQLMLLIFDLAGNLVEPPLELTRIRFARHPRIRATPTGVLIGFQGMPDTIPHQIYTISAHCEVEEVEGT